MLVRSSAVDLIIIDSVAALTPQAEIEGDMGASHMGLQARLMSQALRKLTANIKRANTMLVFINQIRMKIGVMFGNPETTTGGNALKFYALGCVWIFAGLARLKKAMNLLVMRPESKWLKIRWHRRLRKQFLIFSMAKVFVGRVR